MTKQSLFSVLCSLFTIFLVSCSGKQEQASEPVETLPDGPLYKTFTSPEVDMQIQLSMRALVEKAGLSDSLLLPMAHDSLLIVDSLISRLPAEVQGFLEGFSPVDGWSESLLPDQLFDLAIISPDKTSGTAYLTAYFDNGKVDLKMYNYKAFNSMYTFPDDLEMIHFQKDIATFQYKVHGDSLITADIYFVEKGQNSLLTLRQLSDQLNEDDYDSDDYAE